MPSKDKQEKTVSVKTPKIFEKILEVIRLEEFDMGTFLKGCIIILRGQDSFSVS